MDKLVIHPTTTAQWHALVLEAQSYAQHTLEEELESYLVFLLMRFTEKPELSHSILALDYLNSHQSNGSEKRDNLRDVGDKCLLYAGLFPGSAKKRLVRVNYFVDLGKSAYHSLSEVALSGVSHLFSSLSEEFVTLMDVLQATRELTEETVSLTPIEAEELWQDTQSKHALKTLKKFTQDEPLPLIPATQKKDSLN